MTRKSIDYEYLEEEYYSIGRFPIWLEYHIDLVVIKLDDAEWAKENELHDADDPAEKAILKQDLLHLRTAKREQVINQELEKLDLFCEVMTNSEKSNRQAENEVYGEQVGNFYLLCAKLDKTWRKTQKLREFQRVREANSYLSRPEDEEEKETEDDDTSEEDAEETEDADSEEDSKPETSVVKEKLENENLISEKGLSADKREELFAKGFRRLKTSPFGNSGAAYYWVNPRYNESKEHAFFCYLIEAELKKHVTEITTNETYGPDIEFEHKGKRYCFDVETGKNLTRHPDDLEAKFSRYKEDHAVSFIFITDKKFKYKYSKFGTVVTRAKLKETLAKLFA